MCVCVSESGKFSIMNIYCFFNQQEGEPLSMKAEDYARGISSLQKNGGVRDSREGGTSPAAEERKTGCH